MSLTKAVLAPIGLAVTVVILALTRFKLQWIID
jgi:hypothetical protein